MGSVGMVFKIAVTSEMAGNGVQESCHKKLLGIIFKITVTNEMARMVFQKAGTNEGCWAWHLRKMSPRR